ncbi:hypothetical protein KXV85_005642, partial [Aspergillus fumigatus]
MARERDQLALRREAEHLVVEQLELGMLEEFLRIGAFRQHADGVPQPGKGVGFALEPLRKHQSIRIDASRADLVAQVATETPESARVFAGRIAAQPSLTADAVGLRKWVLNGLQRHVHDPKRMVHYFEWADPL